MAGLQLHDTQNGITQHIPLQGFFQRGRDKNTAKIGQLRKRIYAN